MYDGTWYTSVLRLLLDHEVTSAMLVLWYICWEATSAMGVYRIWAYCRICYLLGHCSIRKHIIISPSLYCFRRVFELMAAGHLTMLFSAGGSSLQVVAFTFFFMWLSWKKPGDMLVSGRIPKVSHSFILDWCFGGFVCYYHSIIWFGTKVWCAYVAIFTGYVETCFSPELYPALMFAAVVFWLWMSDGDVCSGSFWLWMSDGDHKYC